MHIDIAVNLILGELRQHIQALIERKLGRLEICLLEAGKIADELCKATYSDQINR